MVSGEFVGKAIISVSNESIAVSFGDRDCTAWASFPLSPKDHELSDADFKERIVAPVVMMARKKLKEMLFA